MPGKNYKGITNPPASVRQPSRSTANSPTATATDPIPHKRSMKNDDGEEMYLDSIQNNCKYGYVLPDRCRFMRHQGCECGAYKPQFWDGKTWRSEIG